MDMLPRNQAPGPVLHPEDEARAEDQAVVLFTISSWNGAEGGRREAAGGYERLLLTRKGQLEIEYYTYSRSPFFQQAACYREYRRASFGDLPKLIRKSPDPEARKYEGMTARNWQRYI